MGNGAETNIANSRVRSVLAGGEAYSQERTQRSLVDMAKREVEAGTGRPTALRALFDYWQGRRDGETPPAAAFDPKDAFTPAAFQWISWIDVRHADPLDFVFRAHPGYLFGDWSGKALRDYPNQVHGRSLALEYLTCKMIQQPSYYEITQTVGDVSRTYMRLLLPVADRRRAVSRLYYATRYVRLEVDGAAVPVG